MQWEVDNLNENWRSFKQDVEVMFSEPLKSRTEQEKCSYLLNWVGQMERISTTRGLASPTMTVRN